MNTKNIKTKKITKNVNRQQPLTEKTIEKYGNVELLKNEGIIIDSDPVYCTKKKPGTIGNAIKLLTNFFGVKPPNFSKIIIFQYEIEIIKIYNNGKVVVINAQSKTSKTNDYLTQMRRKKLISLWPAFHEVLNKYKISKPTASVTDFNRILYMLDPIHYHFTSDDKPKEFFVLSLEKNEFPECLINHDDLIDVDKLEYKIRYTNEFNMLDSLFSDNVLDRDGLQYLSLLITMKMSLEIDKIIIFENGKSYLTNPLQYGYNEKDIPSLHGGKIIGIGANKSIKFIEGTGDKVGIALAIDVNRTAFHESMILSEKFNSLLSTPRGGMNKFIGANAKKVIDNMKGLLCHCIHLKNRTIIINDISSETALTKKININGKEMSIVDYYKTKYNIILKYPNHPLVVQKKTFNGCKEKAYFPMELLRVGEYQRVKKNARTTEQISSMTIQSSIPPHKRLSEINKVYSALQLTNNDFLKQVEMSIDKSILSANGRQIKPPTLLCGNNKNINIKNLNGAWEYNKGDTFIVPSTIQNWSVNIIQDPGRYAINSNIVNDFIKMYINCARSLGINISECSEINECPPNEKEIKNLFDYLKQKNFKFTLFMTADSITNIHNLIKLYERKYGIPTQDIKHGTVSKVVRFKQIRTLQNIIYKSNIKNGGHNYEIKNVINSDRMIIGIGFNHTLSDDIDSLSVVGYSANTRKNPTEFVGDIHYIRFARDGQIQFYDAVIQNTIDNFKKSRSKLPKEIIIYRTSGSEGRYNDYCIYEIPYIKAKIKKFAPGAKLTFIVVEKGHNVRFFKDKINPLDKVPQQNVTPGSVVDSGITNPKLCEFFLTSHSGIQGTVTTPKYIILYDDLNGTMDDFEMLTNSLAYCYQIVSSPISLPAPIYIAHQYAERGRNIINANNNCFNNLNKIKDEDNANELLTYTSTSFNNIRINA